MSTKFKPKQWDRLDYEERERFLMWITAKEHPADWDLRTVSCSLCEEVISPSIKHNEWSTLLTVEEQQHEASERHQHAILLQKLAGE